MKLLKPHFLDTSDYVSMEDFIISLNYLLKEHNENYEIKFEPMKSNINSLKDYKFQMLYINMNFEKLLQIFNSCTSVQVRKMKNVKIDRLFKNTGLTLWHVSPTRMDK